MKNQRCKTKRLSAQFPFTSQDFFSDFDQFTPGLSSPLSLNCSSTQPITSLTSNFQSPMKSIQANNSARLNQTEAKKYLIKTLLLESIQKTEIPGFKQSSSTNTGSNCFLDAKLGEDSLVNLESADEKQSFRNEVRNCPGNAGIISLMLEQSTLAGDKKWRKKAIRKMMQTVWTDWFVIGFLNQLEGHCLYGKKNECYIKILGDGVFPRIIEKPKVLSTFQYDWANRRLKNSHHSFEPDAIIINK